MLKQEATLIVAVITAIIGFYVEHSVIEQGGVMLAVAFTLVFSVIIGAAFRVAYHAEVLAQRFGEPYGTMLLTIAAVTVEVVMLVIIMTGTENPTLARDTIYSAIMIDMNGILGVAAIIGGIHHGEQKYNMDGSNSYISMLLVAVGISMFIPEFISADNMKSYFIFSILVTLILYVIFLRVQTVEHRYFFQYGGAGGHEETQSTHQKSNSWHVLLLVFTIVVIGVLAEILAVFLDHGMEASGLPMAIPAVLVALISASPEILTAVRAAMKDQMQTVINIGLGASLATVLLTVPVIEFIALMQGIPLEMGLTPLQSAMILLTVLVAMINLHDGESNMLEGAVHFALFATFIALTFIAG
ncbi:MAG: calcium:proton antiporter [Gammaproteobacteria bacterium]|nr:calcium:proton antiporter [Gammaproteobacteria bacterium]